MTDGLALPESFESQPKCFLPAVFYLDGEPAVDKTRIEVTVEIPIRFAEAKQYLSLTWT